MSSYLSPKDRDTLNRFISGFCLQSTQVIVQGRIGKPINTVSNPKSIGSKKWIPFNLAIKDFPEVRHQAAAALSKGLPSFDRTYVIEISLRTSDADALVLEVWSIGITNKCEDKFHESTVYDHFHLLLKSLLCISRNTPAYKLSRRQGNEYVLCYRVYMGKISLSGLGEGFKTLKVGTVSTPVGTLTMSAAYRTTENLHVSTEKLSPSNELLFEVHEDHFSSPITSAQPCHTLMSRLRTFSETSDGLVDNSPSFNTFDVSNSRSHWKASDKDNENVKFIVGTPPAGQSFTNRSAVSPVLAKTRQRGSHSPRQERECSSACVNGFHAENCSKKLYSNRNQMRSNSNMLVPGSSAPSLHCFYKQQDSGSAVDNVQSSNRRPSLPQANFKRKSTAKRCHGPIPDDSKPQTDSGTTFCHWSNSNVTKVKVDNSSKNSLQKLPVNNSSKNMMKEEYDSPSTFSSNVAHLNKPPPSLEVGAFVLGSKAVLKSKLASDQVPSNLPFSDLLSGIESSDDDFSQESDSSPDTSPDVKSGSESERKESFSKIKQLDGEFSKQSKYSSSSDSSDKPMKDDFVMVDLNPAFARNESMEDLSTFYKQCKNAPELVMFEEQQQKGTGEDEALIDFTTHLEEYRNNIADFDRFIKEITKT